MGPWHVVTEAIERTGANLLPSNFPPIEPSPHVATVVTKG